MTAELELLDRTALIPFWARAHDAAQVTPILGDTSALKLAPNVRERFGEQALADVTRIGCCLRNLAIDQWLSELVRDGRVQTVVVIGVGLDTRCQRLLDLPGPFVEIDSVAVTSLRDEWIPNTRSTRIAGDGLHIDSWVDAVQLAKSTYPAIVLEGVLTYQLPERVARFFADLAERLPGAYVLFDSPSPISAWPANRSQRERLTRPAYAWTPWSTRNASDHMRLTIIEEKGFMDFPRSLTRGFSRRDRLIYSLPMLRRSYRLTLARLPTNGLA